MKWNYVILPLITLGAMLFAVMYPQNLSQQWLKGEMDEIHQEEIGEMPASNLSYALSIQDRLHLLRSSGIAAQNGGICYAGALGGIKIDVQTLEGSAEMLTGGEGMSVWNSAAGLVLREENGISSRMEQYLLNGLEMLEVYDVLDQGHQSLRARYLKGADTLKMEYCSITDENDPFFSMTLLCISCTLRDSETNPEIRSDTAFSAVIDEETGTFYALSITGDPAYVLVDDLSRFILMADLIGVACTEYEQDAADAVPAGARYNFGGYSYRLRQGVAADGTAWLEFNPERVAEHYGS